MTFPKPNKIVAEKYIAGMSLFKSKIAKIKLSANESALGNEINLRLAHQNQHLRLIADGGLFLPAQALSILEPSWMVIGQVQRTWGKKQ